MPKICGLLLAGAVLTGPMHLYAQTVTVTPFSESGVTFRAYDPSVSPVFTQFVESSPDMAKLAPYSAIVTNSSGKDVIALTVRWVGIDSLGRNVAHISSQDSLLFVKAPVLPRGAKKLIYPGGSWLETDVGRSNILGLGPNDISRAALQVAEVTGFTLQLDTVIFEDGSVTGPDQSQTVEKLRARRDAADQISRAVLAAFADGRDTNQVLDDLRQREKTMSSLAALQYDVLLGIMVRASDRAAQVNQFLNLPSVANLHRN